MQGVKNMLLRLGCFGLLNLLIFAGPSCGLAAGDVVIRINGSGNGLDMIKPLVEAYAKEVRGVQFKMEKPLGSSGAIKALLAGAIDIALTSKSMTPEQTALGARPRHFGKTPLAIVTEKRVPLKDISTKELEDIYFGRTKKWPNGEMVRIVLRQNEDIDTQMLKELSAGMADAVADAHGRRGMAIAVTDPESLDAVSKTPGGIGAAGLVGVIVSKLPLNILALNGVAPGRKTLADGTYPLAKGIDFVTAGKLSREAEKFLDFVYSNKGRSIAEGSGVLVMTGGK